jgi:hypothetical protein
MPFYYFFPLKVVNLTRKSFDSMQRMALDMGTISKWPEACADIKSYTLPKPSQKHRSAWELTSSGGQNGTRLEAKMELDEENSSSTQKTNGAIERRMPLGGWLLALLFLVVIFSVIYPYTISQ